MPPDGSQAEKHLKKAKEALTTSVFQLRFSKDHFMAAGEFGNAAQEFFACQQWPQAADAWRKCAEQRELSNDPFGAARACEEVGKVLLLFISVCICSIRTCSVLFLCC